MTPQSYFPSFFPLSKLKVTFYIINKPLPFSLFSLSPLIQHCSSSLYYLFVPLLPLAAFSFFCMIYSLVWEISKDFSENQVVWLLECGVVYSIPESQLVLWGQFKGEAINSYNYNLTAQCNFFDLLSWHFILHIAFLSFPLFVYFYSRSFYLHSSISLSSSHLSPPFLVSSSLLSRSQRSPSHLLHTSPPSLPG